MDKRTNGRTGVLSDIVTTLAAHCLIWNIKILDLLGWLKLIPKRDTDGWTDGRTDGLSDIVTT